MVFPGTHWIWSNIFFYFNPDKWFTRMGAEVSGLLEAISKLGFQWRSPTKDPRDKKARPRINPPRLLTGSSTCILKYVEDLRRGLNANIRRKGFFEMVSKSKIIRPLNFYLQSGFFSSLFMGKF